MFRADVGKLELFVFLVISADDKVRCLHQKRGKRQHQEYLAYFDDRVCICDHTACFVPGNTHKEVNYLISKQQENNGAARRGYVDTIIEPEDTRKYVIGAFEMLYTKREDRPDRKHGTV